MTNLCLKNSQNDIQLKWRAELKIIIITVIIIIKLFKNKFVCLHIENVFFSLILKLYGQCSIFIFCFWIFGEIMFEFFWHYI